MKHNKLQIAQLDKRMVSFKPAQRVSTPNEGWLKSIRLSLGMSLQQLAEKLSITKQSVQEMENREKTGSITIKSLRDAADALDMQLVYGFVPKDGSMEALIDRKARELAERIVSRTSTSMKLEDQGVSYHRLQKAIDERAAVIKNELPKSLWD